MNHGRNKMITPEEGARIVSALPESAREDAIAEIERLAFLYDVESFGKVFMARHLTKPMAQFHTEIYNMLPQHKYIALAAPRGSAKSTITMGIYAMNQIAFANRRFIVMISNTFKKASMYLETLKYEVKTNELLKGFFGLKRSEDRWAEGDAEFETKYGTVKVLCRGADQIPSIRGLKFRDTRPDLILLDDVEDDELVRSPERRRQLQAEFRQVVMPAGADGCQYVVIGTILHYDSLLKRLIDGRDDRFYTRLYKALDEE